MIGAADVFLAKAQESLAGAESEFSNGRYNNCANRCYYACFQGAIYALSQAGIKPRGAHEQWSHAFVQAEFAGQLINRRKVYPSNMRDALAHAMVLRQTADYEQGWITQTQALRNLRRARQFLEAVAPRKGGLA